ncbi:uncharacterized protein SAPINGB_P005024 [Magnusiomyces paraingens]|uniref:C2H2-type domain-containing protein n=1 Tax=Magnusiomyces paraingens TaxID=2606893 RepID=A0A5E8C0F5_9ASCO|nr:uncharacterized protein SAPINGB_P005024 [Saprochaete ingens]VVT56380.1 unnamed protein product [Saprochaete ingens]
MTDICYEPQLFYQQVDTATTQDSQSQQQYPVMAYGKKPSFFNNMVNLTTLNSQASPNYIHSSHPSTSINTASASSSHSSDAPYDYLQQLDCPPLMYSPRSSVVSPETSIFTSASSTPDFQQRPVFSQNQTVINNHPIQTSPEGFVVAFDNSLPFCGSFLQDSSAQQLVPVGATMDPVYSSTTPATASENFCDPKAIAFPEQKLDQLQSQVPHYSNVAMPHSMMPIQSETYANFAHPSAYSQYTTARIPIQQLPTATNAAAAAAAAAAAGTPVPDLQDYFVLQSNTVAQFPQPLPSQMQSQPQMFASPTIQFYSKPAGVHNFQPAALPITPVSPNSTSVSSMITTTNNFTTAPIPEVPIILKSSQPHTFPTPSPSPVSLKRLRDDAGNNAGIIDLSQGSETNESNINFISSNINKNVDENAQKRIKMTHRSHHIHSAHLTECSHEHYDSESSCLVDSCISSSEISQSSTESNSRANSPKPRRASRKPSTVDEESKTFTCEHCDRKFRRQEHLKRHFRSLHTREKPFECKQCGKTFSRSDNLSQHARVHTKQIPSSPGNIRACNGLPSKRLRKATIIV